MQKLCQDAKSEVRSPKRGVGSWNLSELIQLKLHMELTLIEVGALEIDEYCLIFYIRVTLVGEQSKLKVRFNLSLGNFDKKIKLLMK